MLPIFKLYSKQRTTQRNFYLPVGPWVVSAFCFIALSLHGCVNSTPLRVFLATRLSSLLCLSLPFLPLTFFSFCCSLLLLHSLFSVGTLHPPFISAIIIVRAR